MDRQKITVKTLLILLFWSVLALIWLSGCANITIEEPNGVRIQVNTLFKDYKIDELVTQWGTAKILDSNSNPIDVKTPYGFIESK